MKEAKLKSIFTIIFIFIMTVLLINVYAVGTTLLSPSDNSLDDDGYLDLRGKCEPTSENDYDGTTTYNITNATLYSNVDGTWKTNKTRFVSADHPPNATFYFNFTNDINQSAEGEFKWNIQCFEQNASKGDTTTNSAFAGNKTITVRYAKPTVVTTSPADGSYSLDGTSLSDKNDITINCSVSPSSGWNLTKIELYDNADSSWNLNSTFNISSLTTYDGGVFAYGFVFNGGDNTSIADGTDVLYGCLAAQVINLSDSGNEPLITTEDSSANRTLNVEYPPLITLNTFADGNWSPSRTVTLSWTVTSAFVPSGTTFLTRIWTNETGEWLPQTGTITAINNTAITKTYVFPEKSDIDWTVEAIQSNDANVLNKSVNRTIHIDSIVPILSVESPSDGSVNNGTVTITYTATDTNLAAVKLYQNGILNWTNTTPLSGTEFTWTTNMSIADGNHNFSLIINDSAGHTTSSGNITVTIDTTMPTISVVTNVSIIDKCDQRNITFTTSEITNSTLTYDTDIDVSDGTVVVSSPTKTTSHGLVLDFDFNGEIPYYFNITTTDVAGNENRTHGQTIFQTPARVCSGWSQYAIYNTTDLAEIQNSSGADLVYIWNATSQGWIFKTAGLTTNDNVEVGFTTDYHVVHLFENTNSTWFRSIVNQGSYNYNVTSVNNFISVPTDYNFGNLTESFMNVTNFPSFIANTTDLGKSPYDYTFGPFNVTFFAGYNNSLQDYVSHIFNFTWANATLLEPCPNRTNTVTCMETFWVASNFNITWNSNNITRNWTI